MGDQWDTFLFKLGKVYQRPVDSGGSVRIPPQVSLSTASEEVARLACAKQRITRSPREGDRSTDTEEGIDQGSVIRVKFVSPMFSVQKGDKS